MSRVLVSVVGGVAYVSVEDENTQVLIVDYDVDGNDETVKDPDEEDCVADQRRIVASELVAQYFDHFKPKGE